MFYKKELSSRILAKVFLHSWDGYICVFWCATSGRRDFSCSALHEIFSPGNFYKIFTRQERDIIVPQHGLNTERYSLHTLLHFTSLAERKWLPLIDFPLNQHNYWLAPPNIKSLLHLFSINHNMRANWYCNSSPIWSNLERWEIY